jgi:hypothetical protein
VTAADVTAIKKYLARLEAKPSGRFRVSKDGSNWQIGFDHPDQLVGRALVMDALASADEDFLNGIMYQLANASAYGQDIDERGLNFMLSVIKGIEPRDQLEAMLAAQMAAVHVATMTFARRLAHAEEIAKADSAERAFNKLTRTFAMQVEALRCYRSGCFSRRRGPGDYRQRHTRVTQERSGEGCAGQGCDAPAGPSRCERRANANHGQKQGTRPTCSAAQVKQMNGDHKRNTGPMLSSLRCGARTRSGTPCRSPSVHGKRRCRMHGGASGSGAPAATRTRLSMAATRARLLRNARTFENWCSRLR